MPRRDLTEERTEQILDAFETCIVRYGLESSSLEKVAEQAQMKRPIIRHYVGNRDELVLALTQRVVARFRDETHQLIEALGKKNRVSKLIKRLFTEETDDSQESVIVFNSLVHAALITEPVRKLLADWTTEFISVIEQELIDAYPKASGHAEIAYGIVSIYFNYISFNPLQVPQKIQKNGEKAAHRFVRLLEE